VNQGFGGGGGTSPAAFRATGEVDAQAIVPEPAGLILAGVCLASLGLTAWRHRA
jgi:hypothetical protein